MLSTTHKISVTEFKATSSKVMDEVHNKRIKVIITKHGKPIAMLVPTPEASPARLFGCMANTAKIHGDIVANIIT